MQMQKLRKPRSSSVLRPLQRLLLPHIIQVAPRRKPMFRAREVLIVIRHSQRWNDAIRISFELRREHRIVLGSEDLHGDVHGVNLLFGEKGWVRGGDAVDEIFSWVARFNDYGKGIDGQDKVYNLPLAPSLNTAHPP